MSMRDTNWPLHTALVLASLYVFFFGCFTVRLIGLWLYKRRSNRRLPRATARRIAR